MSRKSKNKIKIKTSKNNKNMALMVMKLFVMGGRGYPLCPEVAAVCVIQRHNTLPRELDQKVKVSVSRKKVFREVLTTLMLTKYTQTF